MPRYISKDGVFHPAKEKVSLVNYGKPFKDEKTGEMVNTGDPYIYEGPDRAALYELWKNDPKGKVSTMGRDFRFDPEFMNRVKQLGYKDVEEYLKIIGFDPEESEKEFTEKASVINKHELPKKVKFVQNFSGGSENAGEGNDVGAFSLPPSHR